MILEEGGWEQYKSQQRNHTENQPAAPTASFYQVSSASNYSSQWSSLASSPLSLPSALLVFSPDPTPLRRARILPTSLRFSTHSSPAPTQFCRKLVGFCVHEINLTAEPFVTPTDGLVNSDTATEENLTPLLNQLVTALNTGSASIDGLKGKINANADQQDVANRAAEVTTVNNLLQLLVYRFGSDIYVHFRTLQRPLTTRRPRIPTSTHSSSNSVLKLLSTRFSSALALFLLVFWSLSLSCESFIIQDSA